MTKRREYDLWGVTSKPRAKAGRLCSMLLAVPTSLLAFHGSNLSATSVERGGFCSRPALPTAAAPPTLKARLKTDRESVAPAGNLRMRVENLGSKNISYGYEYRLQRFQDGSWVQQPAGPFFAGRLFAPAGTAGPCQGVRVAGDATPGTYRLVKRVTLAESARRESLLVRTTFRVH